MQLAAWVSFCLIGAIALRNRPIGYLSAVLVLWFLVPTVGSPVLTGEANGALSLHAATWLILCTVAVQLLHNTGQIFAAIARHIYVFLAMALVIGAALLATLARRGGGMVLLIDQVLAPLCFFLVVVAAGAYSAVLVRQLRNVLLILAAVVSLVAMLQWLRESVIFYEAGFASQYWFDPEDGRWMGTTDQPLALSLALCVTAPLISGLRRLSVQLPLLALLGAGVLISQSRVGVIVYAVLVVYIVLRSRLGALVKGPVLAVVGAAVVFVAYTPLVVGITARFQDDTGSAEARGEALEFFLANWTDYLFVGAGTSASYRIAEQGGLETSLESSILMYAVDMGVVFAVLYFGVLIALVLLNLRQTLCVGLAPAVLLALAIPQTYSALATRSVAGILMWTMVAMIVVAGEHSRTHSPVKEPRTATPATRLSSQAALATAMRAAGRMNRARVSGVHPAGRTSSRSG